MDSGLNHVMRRRAMRKTEAKLMTEPEAAGVYTE